MPSLKQGMRGSVTRRMAVPTCQRSPTSAAGIRPLTGCFQMALVTVRPCQRTSRGCPTLTDTTRPMGSDDMTCARVRLRGRPALVRMHDREVDVDLEGAVEVVGQHVHGDVADDVAELSIGEPGAVGGVDVAVEQRLGAPAGGLVVDRVDPGHGNHLSLVRLPNGCTALLPLGRTLPIPL